MSEILPLDSSLPWLWIIEYLAGFKQVDTNILNDLIERAPDLSDDPGKNAKERIALRCLEELFDPIVRCATDATPASRVRFDLSQSCEYVLQCILQESSVSDLKNTRPELFKWDLYPFIMHKRATLPKCTLEELKDTILSSSHPYAAALKEISGLVRNNEPDGVTECNDHHNALTSRLYEGSSNAQTVPEKCNVAPLILENGNRILKHDLCLKHLLPSKRVRSELAAEDLVELNNGNKDSLLGHNGFHLNAKKLKQGCQDITCTNPSVGQISIPLLLEDTSEKVIRVTEVGCSALHKESQVGERSNDDHIENGHDGNDICENIVGDGSVQFVTVDETQNGEQRSLSSVPLVRTPKVSVEEANDRGGQISKLRPPNPVSPDGMRQNSNPRVARADSCYPCDDEMLSDSFEEADGKGGHNSKLRPPNTVSPDGMRPKSNHSEARSDPCLLCDDEMLSDSDEFNEEGIDIAIKKSHFLSSQCTSSQDTQGAAGWTEQNLCLKCNKDGQVLLCGTSGCPLVVHESCLGFQARFDDKGNFHCPFCAYSLSIAEYLDSKKKERLARKKLSAFIRLFGHCSMELTEGHGQDQIHSRLKRDEFLLRVQNGHLRENEQNPTDRNGENANCQFQRGLANKQQSRPSMSFRDVNAPCVEYEANLLRIQESRHSRKKEQNSRSRNGQDANPRCQSCLADKQQPGSSTSCRDMNTQSMEDEVNGIRIQQNGHSREKEQNTASQNRDLNCQIQRNLADKQPSGPSMSCTDVNKLCTENASNALSGTEYVTTMGKEGKEKMVKENLSEIEPEKQGAQLSDSPDYNRDNPFCENTETIPIKCREAEAGIQKEVLQQHIINHGQQPVILNFDAEDASDTETNEFVISTSIPCRDVNTSCIEAEANVLSRTVCIPTLGKESKEEAAKENLTEREHERRGAHLTDSPGYKSGNPSSETENTETAPVNQREAETGIQKEVLRQHITNPDQQPVVLNFGEDTSETEGDEVIRSNYSIRFRSQQRKCTYLAVPQMRRKRVPWTIEEEQMLWEGVSKFASTAGGNIPWKEILDFGSSVFLKCRTTVDLKDKWRNICKGSPQRK